LFVELGDNRETLSETFKFIATLFMTVPDAALVEAFQEFFMVESSTSLDDISIDFENIFFDTLYRLDPYESSYCHGSDAHAASEKVRERLYNVYLREGLILDEGINIQPDHIAAELFFVSYLVETDRKESLRVFMEDHAMTWIPGFCDDLYEKASSDFYKELAAITKDLILTEYEQLST
jgi:TorA maturation chaperone TorD